MSAPSAWKIQAALAAWKEQKERIENEEMEASFTDFPWNETDNIDDIIANIVRAAKDAEVKKDACAEHMAFIRKRMKHFVDREAKFRQMAIDIMMLLGERKKEFHDFTISVTAGRPSVRVIDEAAIPKEYKRVNTVIEIDRMLIMDDLKDGVVIDGVELTKGASHLTIRTA